MGWNVPACVPVALTRRAVAWNPYRAADGLALIVTLILCVVPGVYVVPPAASMTSPVVFKAPLWHSVQLLSPGTPETAGGGPLMLAKMMTGITERMVTH